MTQKLHHPNFKISSPSDPIAIQNPSNKRTRLHLQLNYIPNHQHHQHHPHKWLLVPFQLLPPPRVSPPPPTQDNASMDITLTLSPNTPLDVQFDTPSPSPPIIAHPIPWNFLEAHGNS
ncbi:hypothetical protein Tco_0576295 [Tanacetum coccineum]